MAIHTKSFISKVGYQFNLEGYIGSSEVHGNGNVNDTFLLFCEDGDSLNRYTLQRINHDIFKNPEGLMENFSRVTRHLRSKIEEEGTGSQCLSLVPAKDGRFFHKDSNGNYWRVTKFVDGGRSFEVPEDIHQAYEAAKAFGDFQAKLADLPGDPLIETIPDFHNTRMRFEHFRMACEQDKMDRAKEVSDLVQFAMDREELADLIKVENFPSRVVHNDTKLNNVLLHKTTGEGMCVVDLDTVMTGCVLHDFGDLVRTAACSALEDEPELDKVFFLPKTFEAIVEGYLKSAGSILESSEIEHLAVAPQIITYELGLRFLTDYLEGDVYFKVKRDGHNLDRVRAQFRLLASMEEHLEQSKQIVQIFSRSLLAQ
ncbi:MAG: aminoglycoside phosphotransferase family protein [Opitutales bacterium]|nr:aminoglycoside phosphotransferase family protein [Opitutales bacterium]